MALNLNIVNTTEEDVIIADMGMTVPALQSVSFSSWSPEALSKSEDILRALLDETIYIEDGRTNTPLNPSAAIKHVASGGIHDIRNRDGLIRVHASPRPLGTLTYFCGAGDDYDPETDTWAVGEGDRLLFNMTSKDDSKHVDMVFKEDVYIKDGFMIVEDAPFGAYMEFTVFMPTPEGLVAINSFGKKVPLLRNGWFELDSEDCALMPYGLMLRVSVRNSSGENGEDSPATFKVMGRIEMFRANTVDHPLPESAPMS